MQSFVEEDRIEPGAKAWQQLQVNLQIALTALRPTEPTVHALLRMRQLVFKAVVRPLVFYDPTELKSTTFDVEWSITITRKQCFMNSIVKVTPQYRANIPTQWPV